MNAHAEDDFTPLPQLSDRDLPENEKRLLRVAILLFAEKGYSGTSVREIVQAAEVTNPMLYYYFDSKEGLFRQLVSFLFEMIGTEIREALVESEGIDEMVEGIIAAHFREARRAPIALKFAYAIIYGPSETAPSFDVLEAREGFVQLIADEFDAAIREGDFEPSGEIADGEFLTELLLGLISSHLQRALAQAETNPNFKAHLDELLSEEMADRLKVFYFEGAGRHSK